MLSFVVAYSEKNRVAVAKWRAKKPEAYGRAQANYLKRHPLRRRLSVLKANSKRHGYASPTCSQEEFEQWFCAQDQKQCGMCGKEMIGAREPMIDHSHIDGSLRGLICCRCNRALGVVEDKELMSQAGAYLKRSNQ